MARAALLILLVAAGTALLVRRAPGYFADARELDAAHASTVRSRLAAEQAGGSGEALRSLLVGWARADFGVSRQYGIPVRELLLPRMAVTGRLLLRSVTLGWLLALGLALPVSTWKGRWSRGVVAGATALLLAIPIGALATVFLLANTGGPTLAVGVLVAARDFRFLLRLLRVHWGAPHVVLARAQGLRTLPLVGVHLLAPALPALRSLAVLSFVTALGMVVPAEVLFDTPGLGQLAWTAATNRDAPVLLAITVLVTLAVAMAGTLAETPVQATPEARA